jgi:hypothetical protein
MHFVVLFKNHILQKKSITDVSKFVAKMCHKFVGLHKLLFFFRKWVERHGISHDPNDDSKSCVKPKIIDAVVVMYGLGELKKGTGGWLAVSLYLYNFV